MSTELHQYPPPAALTRSANVAGPAAYERLVAEAERDHEGYWSRLAGRSRSRRG
jgi:acetyl-CoA synthetase